MFKHNLILNQNVGHEDIYSLIFDKLDLMRFFNTLLFYSLFSVVSMSGQCTYLAYDAFDYTSGVTLNGLSGGTGWLSPWDIQNAHIPLPGYQTSTGSLTFGDLQTLGIRASGGRDYVTTGRRLNDVADGPFSDYVAEYEQGIGTLTGDTLWVSFLLRKDQNNSQPVSVDLHSNNNAWCPQCNNIQIIGVGYYGAASEEGGERRWSLNLNNTIYISPVEVEPSTSAFIVMRIIFTPGDTDVDLYINPTTLGTSGPPSPTLSHSTGAGNIIRSLAIYLGNSHSNGSIDEIRFASSYPCVAPDNTVTVNLPPIASFTKSTDMGQAPLLVTFDASSSFDPENQALTYTWNFGDGSPTENGAMINHTYTALGILNVSLTVTDDLGLQHTTYQTISVMDENNTFPCQTTVTCFQMASCSSDNGRIRVNTANTTFALYNSMDEALPLVGENQYHNLAPGPYTLYVAGNSNACHDTIYLFIKRDSTTCPGWVPGECSMEIGTNMSGFNDWSVERPMKNLFKHIRNEILTFSSEVECWDCHVSNQLTLDVSGYPIGLPQNTTVGPTMVRYILSSDGGNLRQDSMYVLLYDGEGTITMNGGVNQISSTPGRIQFSPTNNGNIWIHILESNVANHARNFRLLRIQDELANLTTDAFYEVFLDKIEPFSTLRFMDWGATNNSPNVEWNDRGLPTYFTYAGEQGVPYETMVQLANQLEKDVWICVPHQANDDYIMQMATLFRDSLHGDAIIYLEYSNEVWNWIFSQAHYNNDNRPSNLTYGRAMAERAKNVFQLWHDVFGEDRCRVKRVLGIQAGFNSLNEQILSQLSTDDWDYGSPTHYFGLDHGETGNPILGPTSTVQDVMLNAQNSWNSFKSLVKTDYNNIHIYGKKIVTYEGGQHFVGNVFGIPYPYQGAMWEAQNSDEMYDMYDMMHDTIRSWGCRMAANFSLSSVQESVYGSWGVLPDIDVQGPYTLTAKKYQALLDNRPDTTCQHLNTWLGKEDHLWSNICNWDKSRLPNDNTTVIIPSSTPFHPMVDIDGFAKEVRVATNAVLTILTGFQLNVVE